jgi:hypothetical protein
MTWAAMDVHARSTTAAALDVQTGELVRKRFDTGRVDPVVDWLVGLPALGSCCAARTTRCASSATPRSLPPPEAANAPAHHQ